MYVERQILTQGTHLALDKEYEIKETIGEGASCIVYLAENCLNSRKVLIKELYPIELGIFRDEFNALIIPTNFQKTFEEYKAKLKRAVQLQIEFHNAEDSCNSTSDAEEIIEYNNTLYVIMGRVAGTSYDKHTPENLASVLTIGRSLANAIAMYHSKEYLHLDIKAENVFKIKETDELIKLFDFDSVHTKNEVQNGECNISFTLSSASPELRCCNYKSFKDINETSDLFSIGALMFKKIMGRDVDVEDSRYLKKWDYTNIDLLKTVSPQTKSVLTDIFRKTLARNKKDRYQTATELISALDKAIELSKTEIFLANHNITTTTSKDYYISRTDKLKEIREKLDNYHIAYLYGIGGIGKSETAREYAEVYRKKYTSIQSIPYIKDLENTIASIEFISNEKDHFHPIAPEERYNFVLNLISNTKEYNNNTLLIIDNYNVSPDSNEFKKNIEVIKILKKLAIHILFTTRTSPNDGNRKIDIDELTDLELKELFFAINPEDRYNEERIKKVEKLISLSFKHTLTVDLVAHQTVQIEEYDRKTLDDYIALFEKKGLNYQGKPVVNNKDNNEKNLIILEHIKNLFDFSELTDKEHYVMVNACLLPDYGMKTAEFCEFINLANYENNTSYSNWAEDETITNLVNRGWIKKVGENKHLSLHPIISEVIINDESFKLKKIKQFLDNLSNYSYIADNPNKIIKYIEWTEYIKKIQTKINIDSYLYSFKCNILEHMADFFINSFKDTYTNNEIKNLYFFIHYLNFFAQLNSKKHLKIKQKILKIIQNNSLIIRENFADKSFGEVIWESCININPIAFHHFKLMWLNTIIKIYILNSGYLKFSFKHVLRIIYEFVSYLLPICLCLCLILLYLYQ